MKRLVKDFILYLKAVFLESRRWILTAFDILGIVLFLFPSLGESVLDSLLLARTIGGSIFFGSFLLANFTLHRKFLSDADSSVTLSDRSLLLYRHDARPSSAVMMKYVGKETIKDLHVRASYIDENGNERTREVQEFFASSDPRMVWGIGQLRILEPGEVTYFHIPRAKSVLDGKVKVLVTFVGANSEEVVEVERELSV
jgi:hypothetical protein